MNFRQLEYFVATAEELSFTRAAKRLFVSQATLSQQVRALEHEIGVKLLERDSRHVRLTGAGSVFLEEARSMLSRAQDALARTRAADNGPEGELRVGYVKGYERTDLPEMLFDFHERYPGVRLSFLRENVAELYDALRAEEVDLVINLLYDGAELGEIQYQVLRHYPLLAVVPASSPLAWKGSLRMSDLAPYPLVDIHKGAGSYGEGQAIARTLAETGAEVSVSYVSEDVETSILAVACGMGYALLPGYFTSGLYPDSKVMAMPIEGKEHEMTVCAAWLARHKNELLDVFLDEFLLVDG